jgi:DNA-binding GntR family transcriptional regulator
MVELADASPVMFSSPYAEDGAERLSDRVCDQLRTMIMTLEIAPGAALNEGDLLVRLQCGRTPLREAMIRLAEEWLIVILPRRAVTVAPIRLSDLRQIYEARIELECASIALAAERASDRELEELDRFALKYGAQGPAKPVETVFWDYQFHRHVASASGNMFFADTVRRLLGPSMRLTFMRHEIGASPQDVAEEHYGISHALKQRRPAEAKAALKAHLERAKERMLKLI